MLNARIGADVGLEDLRWVSYFQMHSASSRRSAKDDDSCWATRASLSPMGGEGINSALMDGADIAWKLALVLGGAAKASLLEIYAIERGLADRHVLDVSNEIHGARHEACRDVRRRRDAEPAAGARSRGSAFGPAQASDARRLLSRKSARRSREAWLRAVALPDWSRLDGRLPSSRRIRRRAAARRFPRPLGDLVAVVDGRQAGLDPDRAGLPEGGVVLVRPDGFIGFRRASADEAVMKALDQHLATYLHPNFAAADKFAAQAR